jgi:3-carboxy-cis,cis-muconate cycloisomerase
MSASPFTHPWLSKLLGDDQVAEQFSPEIEHMHIVAFERALALAEGAEGVIPSAAAAYIAEHIGGFTAEFEKIAEATARDGVVVPEFVLQLRAFIGAEYGQYVHFGTTSQDVTDTTLVLRLCPVLREFKDRLDRLRSSLADIDRRFGPNLLMGRTRMQDALAIRVSDKVTAWDAPIARHIDRLTELTPRFLLLQFGGAVGTRDRLGDKGQAVATRLAEALGLGVATSDWHTGRDSIVELADWLSLVSGSLGKLGADIAFMTQTSVGEITLADGGTSSAMPGKSNPVAAEILVALARYNATLIGGMHQSLVHEQERSGAAWTLEWLVLPQMVMTTAASLRTTLRLCANVQHFGGDE